MGLTCSTHGEGEMTTTCKILLAKEPHAEICKLEREIKTDNI
jgi:hypothetical protein